MLLKLIPSHYSYKISSKDYLLVPKIGGQIAELIKSRNGKKIRCSRASYGKIHDSYTWIGHEDPDGLEAETGKKYWLIKVCLKCGFKTDIIYEPETSQKTTKVKASMKLKSPKTTRKAKTSTKSKSSKGRSSNKTKVPGTSKTPH